VGQEIYQEMAIDGEDGDGVCDDGLRIIFSPWDRTLALGVKDVSQG
jgi:hypothetical protein